MITTWIWRIMGLTCTTYRLSTFSISGHKRVQRIFKSLMNASTPMVCKKELFFFNRYCLYLNYIKQFAGALMMINTYNVKKIACTTPSHPKSEPLKQSQDLDTPWAEIFFKSFPYLMFFTEIWMFYATSEIQFRILCFVNKA